MRLRIRIEKYEPSGSPEDAWVMATANPLTPFDVEPTGRTDWIDGLEEGARVLARDIGHLTPSELRTAISDFYRDYPQRMPSTAPSVTPNPDAAPGE